MWLIIHTNDIRCAADHMEDALYVSEAFNSEFGIRMVDNGRMLGVDQKQWTDTDGILHT